MTFSLDTLTKAKLLEVGVLSTKNRPVDANPGVVLAFQVELPNSALIMLNGGMRQHLYTKNDTTEAPQRGLEGVEPVSDLPNLSEFGKLIKPFGLNLELTGYCLTFDHGLGGKKSDLVIEDVKLDDFHVHLKEGGTVILKLKAEANDVDERTFGKLATLKSRDVQILMAAPEIAPDLVEDPASDKAWPFPNDPKTGKPPAGKGEQKTPEQAFAETAEK